MTHRPNTDLVTMAWLKLVPGVPVDQVATKLPKDLTVVREHGFVRVLSGIASRSPIESGMRRPVVQIECWYAPKEVGSQKVPWGQASDIAEAIYEASQSFALMGVEVDLSPWGDYGSAIVNTVNALEPRKMEGDPSGFARFDVDAEINWTRSE